MQHLREDERRVRLRMVRPGGGAAAIQIPVPQPERDHVRGPDHPAGGQQPGGVAGEELVVGEDVLDQADGGEQVRHRDEGDHHAGDDPQPGFLPVDAARVPDDQRGQQREQCPRITRQFLSIEHIIWPPSR